MAFWDGFLQTKVTRGGQKLLPCVTQDRNLVLIETTRPRGTNLISRLDRVSMSLLWGIFCFSNRPSAFAAGRAFLSRPSFFAFLLCFFRLKTPLGPRTVGPGSWVLGAHCSTVDIPQPQSTVHRRKGHLTP
jgi:hypothetical protein